MNANESIFRVSTALWFLGFIMAGIAGLLFQWNIHSEENLSAMGFWFGWMAVGTIIYSMIYFVIQYDPND